MPTWERDGIHPDLFILVTVSTFWLFWCDSRRLLGRGEFLRWFPPYMRKVPPSTSLGARWECTWRLGHMQILMTVSTFRAIVPPWRAIPETLLGYIINMASRGGPRVPKRCPGRCFWRDKGGIPKVVPPLYEEGPPQCQIGSGLGSNLKIWRHVDFDDRIDV